MALSTWVYRLSDGLYLYGGFYDPPHDPATQGVDTFPDATPHPDPRLQRHDAVNGGARSATTAETAAYDSARQARVADPAGEKLLFAILEVLILHLNAVRGALVPPQPPLTVAQIKAQILTAYGALP